MGRTSVATRRAAALPAQRGGAKALLLTVLGEFVLPSGGSAWTSSLVTAADALGIGEKNARQALARIGDQGLIAGERHGRVVRWSLTPQGRQLLEPGARRIYEFGTSDVVWEGEWLVVHCAVAESNRSDRAELRKQLGFLGFGEVSASLLVSPHVKREVELRCVLAALGLAGDSIVLRSTLRSDGESADMVRRAWDVDELHATYEAFTAGYQSRKPASSIDAFRAIVELVHDWRRFPFIDPELPTDLLPDDWAGAAAADVFAAQRAAWSPSAQAWFADLDADNAG